MDMNTELENENGVAEARAAARKPLTEEQKKAFKEKEAAKKAAYKKGAVDIKDLLEKSKLTDKLTVEAKTFLDHFTNTDLNMAKGNTFNALFPNVKVGSSVTLKEAMERTLKGMGIIDAYVKVWAKKGIVVEKKLDAKEPIKSTYTIKALPQ